MKKGLVFSSSIYIGILTCIVLLSSCKKKEEFENEDGQDAIDIRLSQGSIEQVIADINTVIMEQFLLRGKPSGNSEEQAGSSTSVCGVKLDTIGVTKGYITMTYTGAPCSGGNREGIVKFSLTNYPLEKWKQQGCTLKIEFKSLEQRFNLPGNDFTLDGILYLINESGNSWYDLYYFNENSATYLLKGEGLLITYASQAKAKLNLAKRLTFIKIKNGLMCSVQGAGSTGTLENLDVWGQTRNGEAFSHQLTGAYLWTTVCGAMMPLNGSSNLKITGKEYSIFSKLGYNSDGYEQKKITEDCAFGWKSTWSRKNTRHEHLFSYIQ